MDLDFSEFGDFKATNADTFLKNDPTEREYSDFKSLYISGVNTLIIESQKKYHIRLIPWPKFSYFARKASYHFKIGPEKQTFVCAKMQGEDVPCPICKASRIAYNQGDKKKGGDLAAKQRHVFIVIDRNNQAKGPQLMTWSEQAISSLRSRINDPITNAPRAIDDLANGNDILFTKRQLIPGKSPFETVEDLMVANQPCPVSTNMAEVKAWTDHIKEKMTDFLGMFVFASETAMENALLGGNDTIGGLPEGMEDPFSTIAAQQAAPQQTGYAPQPTIDQLFGNIPQTQSAPIPPAQATPMQALPEQFRQSPEQVQIPAVAAASIPQVPAAEIPALTVQTPQSPAATPIAATDTDAVRAAINEKMEAYKRSQATQ